MAECLVETRTIQHLYIIIFDLQSFVICGCLSILSTAIYSVKLQMS